MRPLFVLLLLYLLFLLAACQASRAAQSTRLRTQAAQEWSRRATTPPQL